MAIKLVAIDLDDTLLDPELQISRHCLEIIRQVQDKGVLVTLATGRMYRSALPYARLLQVDVPLITYQGALVKNSRSGEILYNKPVPFAEAVKVMDFFHQAGIHYHCYFDDQLCMERLTKDGKDYSELAGVEPVLFEDLREMAKKRETLKILSVVHDKRLIEDLQDGLTARYSPSQLNITRSKPYYLEVMHPQATKGDALRVVADHYGIAREEVMALGDSYNDLAMIEWAGLGVAMGNARDEVKQAAAYVTHSNEEEGVAEALYKFVL